MLFFLLKCNLKIIQLIFQQACINCEMNGLKTQVETALLQARLALFMEWLNLHEVFCWPSSLPFIWQLKTVYVIADLLWTNLLVIHSVLNFLNTCEICCKHWMHSWLHKVINLISLGWISMVYFSVLIKTLVHYHPYATSHSQTCLR